MKFDINDIVADVQKLYAKDKKAKAMVNSGDVVRQDFKASDGVPIPPTHPIADLANLPCVPYNKIIQFAGNPDTGKSTLCGEIMAAAQASNHMVVLWDSEGKFDAQRYKKQFGGNPSQLALVSTNEILQGGEKVRKLITAAKDRYPDLKILFVWDSVGGSQGRGHAERELDSEKHAQPGQDAKENGAVAKMLVGLFNKYPDSIAVVLANQVYAKIGFMQMGDQTSGGKKIEFHSSLIVQLKRIKALTKVVKGVKMKYGIITRATVSKNHLNQGEMSVHQMDFEITAKGSRKSETQSGGDPDDE